MAGHETNTSALTMPPDEFLEHGPPRRIEADTGLIEKPDGTLSHDQTRECQPTPLTRRKMPPQPIVETIEPHPAGSFVEAFATHDITHEVEVLPDTQKRLHGIGMADIVQLTAELAGPSPKALPAPAQMPPRRLEKACNDPQDARFPAAIGACDQQSVTGCQLEAEALEQQSATTLDSDIDGLEQCGCLSCADRR